MESLGASQTAMESLGASQTAMEYSEEEMMVEELPVADNEPTDLSCDLSCGASAEGVNEEEQIERRQVLDQWCDVLMEFPCLRASQRSRIQTQCKTLDFYSVEMEHSKQ